MASAIVDLAPAADDAERIDRIRLLEELKAAAAAAQAREATAFAASQRAGQAAAGIAAQRQRRGIAAQVGLAMRVSPWRAQRWLGWATILTTELPQTFAQLRAGRTSEQRAMIVARETIWLSCEDRAVVDTELAAQLERLGDRRVEAAARTLAYRLDPAGFVERCRAAENDRRVWLRPAPDTMCRLTALLPVVQGVAAYAALRRTADTAISDGDGRSRGQLMADTVVERLTGQARAVDVPVEINLVMTDQALLAGGNEPAIIPGYGPVPAGRARDLVHQPGDAVPRWIRRLYRDPVSGDLVGMDSRRRNFTTGQRLAVVLRDQICRTPWCDAPIRHVDHVRPVAAGGRTSLANAQGLCAACNYAKQAPGWWGAPPGDRRRRRAEVVIATPTGHRYRSVPPGVPRPALSAENRSPTELRLARLLAVA